MPLANRVYLDHNAGAPLRPEARAAMMEALGAAGNASSVHAEGRAARARIEIARGRVAALVGGAARGVTFTSGGSEANVTVLVPEWSVGGRPLAFTRLLVSAGEHPSVLAGGRFAPDFVEVLGIDGQGLVDPASIAARVAELSAAGERALVSVQLANNETGVIMPIAGLSDAVHGAGGLLHVDAVQAAGRVPIDLRALGADVLTLSAHKLGGPQGAGAIVRADERLAFRPLITGGGQERRERAGTENVAAIAGFGAAALLARAEAIEARLGRLASALEAGILAQTPEALVFGSGAPRLPNTVCFAVPGIAAETALIALDLAGVALSSGAACSSGKVAGSRVLAAMGIPPDMARGALRASLGWSSTEADVARFLSVWQEVVRSLSRERTSRAA